MKLEKLAIFLIVLCLALPIGCQNTRGKKSDTCLLLGVDGVTWKILLPLCKMGKTPVMNHLIEHGSSGTLFSSTPCLSPIIWTSIASGVSSERHGIHDFFQTFNDNPKPELVRSEMVRVPRIWDYLANEGKLTMVLNWWATWPVQPQHKGIMLSMQLPEIWNDYISPASSDLLIRSSSLEESEAVLTRWGVPPTYKSTFDLDEQELQKNRILSLQLAIANDTKVFRTTRSFLNQVNPDFIALYFTTTDAGSHLFWKYYEPNSDEAQFEVSKKEISLYGNIITSAYSYIDLNLGRTLDLMTGDQTVFLVSDHGFGPDPSKPRIINMNKLLCLLGLQTVTDDAVDFQKTLVVDIEPDWQYERKLVLNVQDRTEKGIIIPRDYYRKRQEIRNILESLETGDGKKFFSTISTAENARPRSSRPDIIASFNPQVIPSDTLILPQGSIPASDVLTYRLMSGEHSFRPDGVFIACGNAIRRAKQLSYRSVDITPTILYERQVPLPSHMDGAIMKEIFKPEFLSSIPEIQGKRVEDYPLPGISSSPESDEAGNEEAAEQLRALGYIIE